MTEAQARAHLAVISNAGSSIQLGPAGFAATIGEDLKAFKALAADRKTLAPLEPELWRLVREGEPGAVLYAAMLLHTLGRETREALAIYAADQRPCTIWPGGCSPMPMPLADAVRFIHGENPFISSEPKPVKLYANRLGWLGRASYFALPPARAFELLEKGHWPHDVKLSGSTQGFLECWRNPADLRELRTPGLDSLLAHPSMVARLYGALLLRRIDRAAGERVLDELAASGGVVPCEPELRDMLSLDVPRGTLVTHAWPRGLIAKLRILFSPHDLVPASKSHPDAVDVPVEKLVAALRTWRV